jgi:polyribonucleotide nucleotidyltransferase
MEHKVEIDFRGRKIVIATGKMAKQANGSVTVSCGDTIVLVTAVAAKISRKARIFSL